MNDTDYRLFPLGEIVVTPAALKSTTEQERKTFLLRHQTGSWEQTDHEGRTENLLGLYYGLRISTVHKAELCTILIFTEGDRSATTIMLPEEV